MPKPVAIRPNIRRRSHRVSPDAAHSFLDRQHQQSDPPLQSPTTSGEPPRPTPLAHELTLALAAIRSPDQKELDRFWGYLLDSLAAGRVSPGEGRLIARSLGKVRKTLGK